MPTSSSQDSIGPMLQPIDRLRALRDPALPALPTLLGSDAAELVDAVLGGRGLVRRPRPTGVTWRPGRSLTVRFDASLADRGQRSTVTVILTTGGALPAGATLLERDGAGGPSMTVAGWRMPDDPLLPGLAVAMDRAGAARLVRAVGVTDSSVAPLLRAYRPGRRAVVELRGRQARVFVKVVRPGSIERLQAIHAALADRLPVPRSQGWSPDLGVVVLQALPGRLLRDALCEGRDVPAGHEHEALLALVLGCVGLESLEGRSPSPIERLTDHVRLLAAIMPDESSTIESLVRAIGPETDGPRVPVHGDYYEGQVLASAGRLVGLIDVDTAGLGRPGDDPATLLGHLAVLADAVSVARRSIHRHAEAALRAFDARLDPVDLRRRTAAVVLGLATGPFRVQSRAWPVETARRIALAGRWIESADRVTKRSVAGRPLDETSLTTAPSLSHIACRG
jgi:hypothetical protein